jgi:hypothetical protein
MILEQEGETQQTVDLESIKLERNEAKGRYEAVWESFTAPGKYTVFFYAKEKNTGIVSPFKSVDLYKKGGALTPGDADGSGDIDLADAILVLRISCNEPVSGVSTGADISNDSKIGIEEAVYILRKLAGN